MKEAPPVVASAQASKPEVQKVTPVASVDSADKKGFRDFEVRVNDKTIKVSVRETKKTQTPVRKSQVEPTRTISSEATANGVHTIVSPMGGLVKKLNVGVNDSVTTGQVLLIFEAMKMETEILSQINGKIQSLNVKAGETVGAGHPLLTVSK